MCRIFEEYCDERAAIARNEEIADTTDLPLERVKKIAKKLAFPVMA